MPAVGGSICGNQEHAQLLVRGVKAQAALDLYGYDYEAVAANSISFLRVSLRTVEPDSTSGETVLGSGDDLLLDIPARQREIGVEPGDAYDEALIFFRAQLCVPQCL